MNHGDNLQTRPVCKIQPSNVLGLEHLNLPFYYQCLSEEKCSVISEDKLLHST